MSIADFPLHIIISVILCINEFVNSERIKTLRRHRLQRFLHAVRGFTATMNGENLTYPLKFLLSFLRFIMFQQIIFSVLRIILNKTEWFKYPLPLKRPKRNRAAALKFHILTQKQKEPPSDSFIFSDFIIADRQYRK